MSKYRKALDNIESTLSYDEGIGFYGIHQEKDIRTLESLIAHYEELEETNRKLRQKLNVERERVKRLKSKLKETK